MDIWLIASWTFGLGSLAGLSQLLGSRRQITRRVAMATVLNSGLAAVAACAFAIDQLDLDTWKLIPVAIFTGYGGAPVVGRVVEVVQRLQLKKDNGE